MKRAIVTTTVHSPTPALREYIKIAETPDQCECCPRWQLVIAGDRKTPHHEYQELDANSNVVTYLHPDYQEHMDRTLSDLIGWDCVQRRNFALLYAWKDLAADVVATVDDDNIPLRLWDDWGHYQVIDYYPAPYLAFDPLIRNGNPQLWHRGFPLELLNQRYIADNPPIHEEWDLSRNAIPDRFIAGLWYGEPDVDAICRISCRDQLQEPFPNQHIWWTSNAWSPFNSQNTVIPPAAAQYYFMFPHVGRYDDIWASYYVQALGFRVVYTPPTVRQERHAHDIFDDLEHEFHGYRNTLPLLRDMRKHGPDAIKHYVGERSWQALLRFQEHFQ